MNNGADEALCAAKDLCAYRCLLAGAGSCINTTRERNEKDEALLYFS
jgi:hypothetical protein